MKKKPNPKITKIIKEMPELPPIPKEPAKLRPLFEPEMIEKKTMDKMLNETQRISETISHLRFPSEIKVIGADLQYDVTSIFVAGGIFIGFALGHII